MARILIVEDEPLISMMLEEWIVELGHEPIGPAHTVNEALSLVEAELLDGAIVDFHLHSETAESVAKALGEKHVPFAFASGRGSAMPHELGKISLGKPYDFDAVCKVVNTLVGSKRPSTQ